MATYSDLELNSYYLVIENEGDEISLVQPLMETDACVLLMNLDEYENTYWRKKSDDLFELVDELTEEQLEEYENLFDEEDEDEDYDD
ncbi:hypothetical protein [Parasediminibacterium sp. JCM 36343]|uniref:hypothetical protein n=1 Tax=Parasediminibacterium sp. JCM 36343 TaxID=3374279 RepID=UPI00397C9C08